MSKLHPGFAAVQAQISRRQGVSMDRAGAILAAGTRRAGAKARAKNPRLNRVKGKPRRGLAEEIMER
jgi:hypothetical protein